MDTRAEQIPLPTGEIDNMNDTDPIHVVRNVPLVHNKNTREGLASGCFGTRSLSPDALDQASGSLFELNQEFVRRITESKDVWGNKNLKCLVKEYLDISIKTLEFCSAVDDCVKRSRIRQIIIQFASKFAKTLEELNNVKASGDPFDEDFITLLKSVYEQQVKLLETLQKEKKKLDEKLKNIKKWKKISNVVFVTLFVSALIFSVVAAAVSEPPVVTAVSAALAVPVGSGGKWCNYRLNMNETSVKGQRYIVRLMEDGAIGTKKDMDIIRVHVDKLKTEIESMMQRVELSKNYYVIFTKTIEEVGDFASKCSKNIIVARASVLRHIKSSDEEQGNLLEAITF